MSFSPETIDRIVANVLSQLGTPRPAAATPESPASKVETKQPVSTPAPASKVISSTVITAETLEAFTVGTTIQVSLKAIITPAAQDVVKSRKLQVVRQNPATTASKSSSPVAAGSSLLIVVKNTKALDQLWTELNGVWRRDLVGCPDDAAKLAIGELCRGGATQVVIFAEQTHRAACLANRNEKAKAVAIRDAGDVRLIRKQLRANTWCIDGTGKTYFELKNIFREIQSPAG